MKKQIRIGTFETNSSSTHSICISKAPVTIGEFICFYIGEYGWENDCVNTADYLYTAILCMEDSDELLEKLKSTLDKHSIRYKFEKPKYSYSSDEKHKWLKNGYIDHSGETRSFIDAVLADEDMLMRCLFSDNSCVYTGNDNQDHALDGCDIARETYYEDGERLPNPYHDEEHYDYFLKRN